MLRVLKEYIISNFQHKAAFHRLFIVIVFPHPGKKRLVLQKKRPIPAFCKKNPDIPIKNTGITGFERCYLFVAVRVYGSIGNFRIGSILRFAIV